jgi:hypothetical protein
VKSVFRMSSPADAGRIADFLSRVFHTGPQDLVVRPEHLHWKYWAERRGWHGSRSYTLERDGTIVAHGAAWPSTLRTNNGAVMTAAQIIDWAADPDVPGSGLVLMKNFSKSIDLIFALGGSESTRRILPAFGFRPFNEISLFARPLRPFRQIVTHQRGSWKSAARLARNLWWSISPVCRVAPGWSSRPASGNEIASWPEPGDREAVLGRDAEIFRYFSVSPHIRSALHLVEHNGIQAGYFYLVFAPGQARIADAWTPGADPDSWKQIYALAALRAQEEPGINEVMTIAGLERSQRALANCGFRARRADRLMIYDPNKKLDASTRVHFQLIDNDAFFRHSERPEYET